MTIEFIWQLPTSGDGRYAAPGITRRGERNAGAPSPLQAGVSDPRGARPPFNYFDYLHQIARAADLSGFDGIQVRHDTQGDESWIVAGYLARSTRHLKLIAEFDAAWGSAVYAAKNAVSFQRFTGGRFAWQIGHGGDAAARRRQGDAVPDADILPRIDEFITVARGVQSTSPFSFKGKFFEVQDGGFKGPLANHPINSIYLTGDSPEALALSARQADVHVFDAVPVTDLQPAIASLRAQARQQGRTVAAGVRIDVLARETFEEALRDARGYRSGAGLSDDSAFDGGTAAFWPGFAQAQTGARGALVGSYAQVSAALEAYAQAGISSFVLAAIPHFEEAYRIGEHVLPLVRAALYTQRQAA
ncbi:MULTISPECIES: LLM class flavin-dependent oxidoreductase [unclassified Janthinobacterium]|uniref:LLM class flavin-dependent oxidoreductase n=1 Tax=unclassified Janthinobacterium TaxID=2610881 RepID=UPI001E52CC0E|nr:MULTISPECIES: LLM class flavin-dependent oxidoreductase [unclassified Janthinobacterium]MCC7642206.1 LLM class flavin-dependent oxidoreductase [Janthinobacterium sp. EB271-G4-3-1]MCC7690332.1 LLM class flavin-dependent oxidoreductase [Janthinobacterium sp. EB271-G4-3-2]